MLPWDRKLKRTQYPQSTLFMYTIVLQRGEHDLRQTDGICHGRSSINNNQHRVTPPRYSTRVRAASADTSVDAPSESDAVLQYGVSAVQGPRELMEDCANVVPNGKCGYLYACTWRSD